MAKQPTILCWLIVFGLLLASGCSFQDGAAIRDRVPSELPAETTADRGIEGTIIPTLSPVVTRSQATTREAKASEILSTQVAVTSPVSLSTQLATPTYTLAVDDFQPVHKVEPADPAELAMAEQGLIYLQDGCLWWWDDRSQRTVPLDNFLLSGGSANCGNGDQPTDKGVDFLFHPESNQILLQRATGVTANGAALYEVELIDLSTGENRVFLDESAQLFDWQLSPDGAWITYRLASTSESLLALPTHTNQVAQPSVLCAAVGGNQCHGLIWSPGASQIAWGDNQGLWLAATSEFIPQQVLTGTLKIQDQSGEKITLSVSYQPISWSPYSRYLLVDIGQPRQAEVGWVGLVDLRLGNIVEVPGTYHYLSPGGKTTWDTQGRLVVFRPDQTNQLVLEKWTITPTRRDLLLLDGHLEIDLAASLGGPDYDISGTNFLPDSLHVLDERRMAVTVVDENNHSVPFLLVIDWKIRQVTWAGPIPYDVRAISWPENLAGFLVEGQHGSVLYKSMNDQPIMNLAALFGEGVEKITWLHEIFATIMETGLD